MTEEQAGAALALAVSKTGAPYAYGGRGPDTFDCSGIITWAYRQAIPGLRLKVGPGRYSGDASIEELYRWNYEQVPVGELVPGDLVFITDGSADVTHGGLVVAINGDRIRFLNASSYYEYEKVVEDEWPLAGETRGQRIVGYGRLLVSM